MCRCQLLSTDTPTRTLCCAAIRPTTCTTPLVQSLMPITRSPWEGGVHRCVCCERRCLTGVALCRDSLSLSLPPQAVGACPSGYWSVRTVQYHDRSLFLASSCSKVLGGCPPAEPDPCPLLLRCPSWLLSSAPTSPLTVQLVDTSAAWLPHITGYPELVPRCHCACDENYPVHHQHLPTHHSSRRFLNQD